MGSNTIAATRHRCFSWACGLTEFSGCCWANGMDMTLSSVNCVSDTSQVTRIGLLKPNDVAATSGHRCWPMSYITYSQSGM